MPRRDDPIYRRGEDPLCGIQILGVYGQDESHEAMHRRSEIVANAAIESSRRGDGRFIEGSLLVKPPCDCPGPKAGYHGFHLRTCPNREAEPFA